MNEIAALSTTDQFRPRPRGGDSQSDLAAPLRLGSGHPPARDDRPPANEGDQGSPEPPRPTIVSLVTLQGRPVPARQWLVPDWIPAGVVTGLYGDGGLGKSLIAQQLQTATALSLPWLGLPVENVPSLGVYCEDSLDELCRRQEAINVSYGCEYHALSQSHWMPRLGENNILMAFGRGGIGELTPFHKHLTEAALDLRVRLVVFDTAADGFAGNENDRGQVRQFVSRALGSIAQAIEGSVLLCAHPSRSGLQTGEGDGGSTGWSNSLRSRLFLTAPVPEDGAEPDSDARILQRKKANYAARRDEVRLRWGAGVISPEAFAGSTSSFARRSAEEVFMDLVDAFTRENQVLSESNRASNYAPAAFAKRSEREGYRKADFERALQNLLTKKAIEIVDYGPPSKVRRKLVRCVI